MKRERYLTADEAARLREVRASIEQEKPEIIASLKEPAAGPASLADLREFRLLVRSLVAARQSAGLSQEQLAQRAQLDLAAIVALEEGRDIDPALSLLSRYAAAAGQRVHMGLMLAEFRPLAPATEHSS